MRRRADHRGHRAALDDLARVHHRDPIGEMLDQAEIVGDEQDGERELALQLAQQAEDLRLNGHVERGGRLVGDQQRRLRHQRHRDHHPLSQPAR